MRRAAALLAVATLAVAACGDDDDAGSGTGDAKPLVVSAAASLTNALKTCSPRDTKLSFAGSDELAAQIRQGVTPDVFAAANTTLPDQLHTEGLVREPQVFATNELVIAVPSDTTIEDVEDLARGDVKLAVGADSVPVGAYTREVLGRLPGPVRQAVERNVRTREPDVKGVVGKISQGAVDAGIVYATDVMAAGGELKAVPLPAQLQPEVEYAAAVVKPSEAAQAYVDGLVRGGCQRELRDAGFGPP